MFIGLHSSSTLIGTTLGTVAGVVVLGVIKVAITVALPVSRVGDVIGAAGVVIGLAVGLPMLVPVPIVGRMGLITAVVGEAGGGDGDGDGLAAMTCATSRKDVFNLMFEWGLSGNLGIYSEVKLLMGVSLYLIVASLGERSLLVFTDYSLIYGVTERLVQLLFLQLLTRNAISIDLEPSTEMMLLFHVQ